MTEEFKAAIVQHHWQTRFYQQLSPVIAFVEMVQLGNFFENGFLDMTPSGQGKPIDSMGYDVSKAWMTRCWDVQSDTALVEMATVGIETALEWKTQHDTLNQFGPLEPSISFVRFRGNAFHGALDFKEYHNHMLQKRSSLLSEMVWYLAKGSLNACALGRVGLHKSPRKLRRIFLERLAGHLWYLSCHPSGRDVDKADGEIIKHLTQHGELLVLCASVRATCKDLAGLMAEWWATSRLLFCTPDLPGRRNTRNGAGYRQLRAWCILTKQLQAMAAGRTDLQDYVANLVKAAFPPL
jgi:hypothetical protein